MMRNHPTARRRRLLTAVLATAAAGASALLLVASPTASADGSDGAVPPPPPVPTSADQIQNLDQVKTAIKGYYGDTLTDQVDPVPNDIDGGDHQLHTFDPNGNYAAEVSGIATQAKQYLRQPTTQTPNGAVLFDVDDTTLNTYNYEIYSNFVYNPTTNAAFVNAAVFPAVPHMVDVEKFAQRNHYTVFYLTGRPESQRQGTIRNLRNEGYTVNPDNLYLKNAASPWLSSCSDGTTITCTTIQYKSLTRQHIESDLGYDIVANFGDQFSDLTGGFADEDFKLPNPMYFLP